MVDNGGAAFGHAADNGHCCGMTIRDWFAGMAMQGLIAGYDREIRACASNDPNDRTGFSDTDSTGGTFQDTMANEAYHIADAMIAEKRRTEGRK
jgi:hypothetical protein